METIIGYIKAIIDFVKRILAVLGIEIDMTLPF